MLKLILIASMLQGYTLPSTTFGTTAYCPCSQCNSGYTLTYRETQMGKGIIASDPNVLPLDSLIYVPGYGFGIVHDTGGAIKGDRLDLCYNSHGEALNWGRKNKNVIVIVRGRE